MGNSSDRTEGDRLEPARLVVEGAEIVVHEGDEPEMVVDLLHAHVLAGKDLAQIDLPALVADPPAVRDGAGPVVERVGQRRQPDGEGT